MAQQSLEIKKTEAAFVTPAIAHFNLGMAHINGYALSKAVTQTMGDAQAVLMTKYAENLIRLSAALGSKVYDVPSYLGYLKETGRIPFVEVVQKKPNSISFNIRCSAARTIHNALHMSGYSGDICPLALIFMVVKARELGWKLGTNTFDYIRFSRKMSNFSDSGAKTEFEIVKAE